MGKLSLTDYKNEFKSKDASKAFMYPNDITRASKTIIRRIYIHLQLIIGSIQYDVT